MPEMARQEISEAHRRKIRCRVCDYYGDVHSTPPVSLPMATRQHASPGSVRLRRLSPPLLAAHADDGRCHATRLTNRRARDFGQEEAKIFPRKLLLFLY